MKRSHELRLSVIFLAMLLMCIAFFTLKADAASTKTYKDSDSAELSDPSVTYVIEGTGSPRIGTNYFKVPKGKSSKDKPITIILDNVRYSQEDKSPKYSFIHIESDNYVIIKLRGTNIIKAWSHQETLGSNDGMSAIHVSNDSTVKITSEDGDGKTTGSLQAYGGGGKYGGAAIGARYNKKMGTVIIAGGTIEARGGYGAAGIGSGRNDTDGYEYDVQITGGKVSAYGGYEGAGIGSGRDGKANSISISGGEVYAEGGTYAAGIGAGNSVDAGSGGNVVDITITGGKIEAHGGEGGAGIGCSDEGELSGSIKIDSSKIDIKAYGGKNAAGIGGGNKSNNGRTIEIKGSGTIEAYGGEDGSGIGGGNDGGCGPIIITGDTNGKLGERGAAPSGSRKLTITAVAGNLYGDNSDNDKYSFGNEAAAIGSGKATCGDITINNAVLNTRADGQGADIGGGGYHVTPEGAVKNITIDNCKITSSSIHKVAPGIGSGYGGTVHNISISNTKYYGGGIGGAPMDVPYTNLNDVKSITIHNSDIRAVWDEIEPGKFTGGFTPYAGPQEYGAAGIGSGMYGAVGEITITDSKIYARGYRSGAGIGGGGAGGNGFTELDLTKWDVGDTGTIIISGSDVDAKSGHAHCDPHNPLVFWDGDVQIRIQNPKMMYGAAGIGGGSASDTGKIWIHDCGEINAVGEGAGIGGGEGTGNISKGAVDYIWLENIDYLYAEGGDHCAGIGTGGSMGGVNVFDANSGSLKQIYIYNCKDLIAHGGRAGAGIGLGAKSRAYYHITETEKGDWPLVIIDSNVKAYGGQAAAGIGGGLEGIGLNKGGENPRCLIQGKCQIEALGGQELDYTDDPVAMHGGGAGIGGGSCGACSVIEIDVTEDYDCAAKGTYEDPAPSKYYVKATGRDGGAGIGSGGRAWEDQYANTENADSDTIIIKRGAVFAQGGDALRVQYYDSYLGSKDFYLGAGAGIGGGSFGSTIRYVCINGGYINAVPGMCGPNHGDADCIGAGGSLTDTPSNFFVPSDRKNGKLLITDGTITAATIGEFTEERKVSGGSVYAKLLGATGVVDIDGERVYKTTVKLPKDIKKEKVDGFSTSRNYGGKHIYADYEGKIYLYLYKKGDETDHKQWADIEVNTSAAGKNQWHYTGYTDPWHTGVLKLDGDEIPFKDPGAVKINRDFTLELDDSELPEGTEWTDFTCTGSASITDSSDNQSPGVSLEMHADSIGDYTVTAVSSYSPDSEIYWGLKASFTGTVEKSVPSTITFIEDPSKIYDVRPVTDPCVSTNSPGALTYEYFTDEACTKKTGAVNGASTEGGPPSHAGRYWVKVTVEETSVFESSSAVMEFEIVPAPSGITISLLQSGNNTASAVATVTGLYEADGSVDFTIKEQNRSAKAGSDVHTIKLSELDGDGLCKAVLDHEMLESGYVVEAHYESDSGNYTEADADASSSEKLTTRSIEATRSYQKDYGDEPFRLEVSTDKESPDDVWSYEVISDAFEGYGMPPAVTVDNEGYVTVDHAGRSIIKVTLTDSEGEYGVAETFITVNVKRADLKVTTYAYLKDDPEKKIVSEVDYGKIDTLGFSIEFEGLMKGDKPETFTHGHGTLSPVAIPETTGASVERKEIGIERNGVDIIFNGTERNVFVARDYNIIEDTKTYAIKINKATVAIAIDDAYGIYGGDEPDYVWHLSDDQSGCTGLVSWDSEQTIFVSDPTIARDDTASGEYSELDAGTYTDCLTAEYGWSSDNYEPLFIPGSLTIDPADISDTSRFEFDVEDTEYNGGVQKQVITVRDISTGKKLKEGIDFEIQYPDDAQMTDVGTVDLVITGKEPNYTGIHDAEYDITRKKLVIVTESASKEYDGEALTAAGALEGLVNGETADLEITGSQTEIGKSTNTGSILWNGTADPANYILTESFGTLTVTEPGFEYYCTEGSDAKWKKGSKDGLSFTFKRSWNDEETMDRFVGVAVDGKDVPREYYDAVRGSVIITLDPSYLEDLKSGSHSISVSFEDGTAPDVNFTIEENKTDPSDDPSDDPTDDEHGDEPSDEPSDDDPSYHPSDDHSGDDPAEGTDDEGEGSDPKTGDETDFVTWVLLMLEGLMMLSLMAMFRRIRKKESR